VPANDPARAQRAECERVAEIYDRYAETRIHEGVGAGTDPLIAAALRCYAAVIAPDEATLNRMKVAIAQNWAYRDRFSLERAILAALAGTPSAPDEGEKEQR